MIHRVAQHVQHRLEQRLDGGFVGFGRFALDDQADRFAQLARHFADQPGKALEHMRQRQHANAQYRALQFADQTIEPRVPLFQRLRQGGDVGALLGQ